MKGLIHTAVAGPGWQSVTGNGREKPVGRPCDRAVPIDSDDCPTQLCSTDRHPSTVVTPNGDGEGGIPDDELAATYADFQQRVLDRVGALLERTYDSQAIRNRVYGLAFKRNEVLPKRDRRPKTTTAFVAEQVHRAHDGDPDRRATLVEFAVVVAEYADILDDVVDGDVSEGHESEALLVSQLLIPVLIRSLHALGDRAVDYWTDDALALVQAPLVHEREHTPSAEAYPDLLREQASLRSSITGLAAVAADENEAAVDRAETVGRAVHGLMQFSTDLHQHGWDDDPWNAVELYDEDEFVTRVDAIRADLRDAASEYGSPYTDRIVRFWERDYRERYREAVDVDSDVDTGVQ